MKIAVIGAGAIGALVAGYLKLKGVDVLLAGHADALKAIREQGLKISGARGDFRVKIEAGESLNSKPELVILATKTQDLEGAIKDNLDLIQDALVLTIQNGIQADTIASRYIPEERIISSIVMFGSTCLKPGEVLHNFEGSWVIGSSFGKNGPEVIGLSEVLGKAFPVIVAEDIKGMKYLKIFVNANNCIPALLGVSMQEAFSDVEISRIAMAIWKEGLGIINRCHIELVSLPDFPLERLTKLVSLPTAESAKIYSGIMANLSKEPLYGSILQSIKRGKKSEIDYINGEFTRLAEENKFSAPLNEELTKMVYEVENRGKFFSKSELFSRAEGLVN